MKESRKNQRWSGFDERERRRMGKRKRKGKASPEEEGILFLLKKILYLIKIDTCCPRRFIIF